MLKRAHHWCLPLLAALTWWGMLIALMSLWSRDGFVNYSIAKKRQQTFMYISDVGAVPEYKPIFIGCSATQGLLFTLSVISEFYLRRTGRLRRHCQWWATWALGLSLLFALLGQLGILFVAVFDLNAYPSTHVSMLVVFIVFIGVSALLNVASFAALDTVYYNMRHVRVGLWLKVAWFLVEFVLAVLFVGSQLVFVNMPALLEWIISFVYPFYLLIMVYDLWPAIDKTKGHYPRFNSEYPSTKKRVSRVVIADFSPAMGLSEKVQRESLNDCFTEACFGPPIEKPFEEKPFEEKSFVEKSFVEKSFEGSQFEGSCPEASPFEQYHFEASLEASPFEASLFEASPFKAPLFEASAKAPLTSHSEKYREESCFEEVDSRLPPYN